MFARILILVIVFFHCAFGQELESKTVFLCDEVNDSEGVKLFQGLDGWLFHDGDLVNSIYISSEIQAKLIRVKEVFDFFGIDVVFANLPTRGMFHYDKFDLEQETLKEYDIDDVVQNYNSSIMMLREIGFTTPNLFVELGLLEGGEDYGYIRDSHWNPNAALLTAKILASEIAKNPKFKTLSQSDFELIYHGVGERQSDLADLAMARCSNLVIPKEPQKWYTVEKNTSGVDLFSETASGEVVLLGSSFSTNSSFLTFLQNELKIDVVSYAIGGAGLWTPVFSYFLSKDDDEQHPEFVVWEVPYKLLDQLILIEQYYDELIPTMLGSCDNETKIAEYVGHEIVATEKDEVSVSFDIDSQVAIQAKQNDYYIALSFEDLSVKNFTITYIYDDLSENTQAVFRSSRIRNNGKYYYNILGETSVNLKEVKIVMGDEATKTVALDVCVTPQGL